MKKIELVSNFKSRAYQQSIFANSLNKNSLVVLPTGLGKTVIAIMLCVYYFNQSNKKILFLAPTKPLVEQQESSFKTFFENSDEFNFKVLTGLVSPSKRELFYEENDFIFSTPQLIENDIVNGIINPKDFALLIVDEAHRATGNYAYCFIAEEFDKKGAKILALTASPGTSKEEIQNVMDNLKIENIEVKKYSDDDVKPYVKDTKIDYIKLSLPDEFKKIKENLELTYFKRLEFLKNLGFFKGKNIKQVSKRDLLDLSAELRRMISSGDADEEVWKAISISAGLMKLQYGMELFESQEVSAAHSYFYNFFRAGGDSSKAVQELIIDVDFRDAFDRIAILNKKGVLHPKLIKLKEMINEEFITYGKDMRIIVFNQYRESAVKIVSELSKIKELRPAIFVGQSKKGDLKMTQKDQKEVLDKFREGEYNILVSTSVGEEGLDIPKVDLVVFYEPVPSAIRTIQRVGRTGRFKEGRAYILMSEGTRDIATRHVASAKERRMYKVLDEIRNGNINGKEKEEIQGGLNKFINKESVGGNDNKVVVDAFDSNKPDSLNEGSSNESKYLLYVDNRENNDLIKELYRIDEIEVKAKKLEVGDIIVSEKIAIERKAKADFVNSILDKRLFPQLIDLAKNFQRPILILEGDENIYSIRNLHPNVIRATLSSIAVDLRIPIIFTNDLADTAKIVLSILKRANREKKEISLASDKRAYSEDEEIEKFVSSIPKINVVNVKSLLNHFTSIEKLINASKDELQSCPGIGKKRAEFLYDFFRRKYNN
ncbi:MAG: DEAD/DEAH box helicase family protein [Nanoarchaeota archaeon]|nr:DEAD/DEAH box helicase family protein [Nanoarchaeota archaeon]